MTPKEKPAKRELNGLFGAVRLAAEQTENSPTGDQGQRIADSVCTNVRPLLTLRTLQNDDGHFIGLEVVR